MAAKKKKTVADFPEVAAQWHPTKKDEDFGTVIVINNYNSTLWPKKDNHSLFGFLECDLNRLSILSPSYSFLQSILLWREKLLVLDKLGRIVNK